MSGFSSRLPLPIWAERHSYTEFPSQRQRSRLLPKAVWFGTVRSADSKGGRSGTGLALAGDFDVIEESERVRTRIATE